MNIKTINQIIIIILFLFVCGIVNASALSCAEVDGMAIFGYKQGQWEFIGAIANELDSDSIANQFGAGNEFSSNSIFNEFGSFGSEYSSYSAFNEYASSPPIIVNNEYKFVGYLTINDLKYPSINTYAAINCAKKTYKSFFNDDLKETIFKNIPNREGSYDEAAMIYSQQKMANIKPIVCPDNATYSNGKCSCKDGYTAHEGACVTYTQNCRLKYGYEAYGDEKYCYCNEGYEFNNGKTACIRKIECPENAQKVDGECVCEAGFVLRNGQCISNTDDCQLSFGENVVGVPGDKSNSICNCKDGYEWGESHTACIKKVAPRSTMTPPESNKYKEVEEKSNDSIKNGDFVEEKIKLTVRDESIKSTSTISIATNTMQLNSQKSDNQSFLQKAIGWFTKLFSNLLK